MALVVEKLIKYLSRWHSPEVVRKVAELVNTYFPDAKGFVDETLHESRFAFYSEESAYYVAPEKYKIYYNARKSKARNPKYVFSAHTKEVDFTQKMKSTLLIYRQTAKRNEITDWKKEAAANKKAKEENVDELLAATRDNSGGTFGLGGLGSTSRVDNPRNDPYAVNSEDPKQPDEYEQPAVKIETLDDVKRLNKERKSKPKKAPKKVPKKKKEPATKGIW